MEGNSQQMTIKFMLVHDKLCPHLGIMSVRSDLCCLRGSLTWPQQISDQRAAKRDFSTLSFVAVVSTLIQLVSFQC